jgi:aminomethyltransferase
MNPNETEALRLTPLYKLHLELGGKMVPFAGYEMPVQYPSGILKEHLHTRAQAGLFDVSHMGQRFLVGADDSMIAAALEMVTPGDFKSLGKGRIRYSLLLNKQGGILDDFMATCLAKEGRKGRFFLVLNAERKAVDDAFLRERLPEGVTLESADKRALLALQGPAAESVLSRHCNVAAGLSFMSACTADVDGAPCLISRSGYTGEDGFEISVHSSEAERVARLLLGEKEVLPIGLGARDSLRLEAGLCLYGHDINEKTSPIEAGLHWVIGKRRQIERDFPAAELIMKELLSGPCRKRVGIRPEGKAPAREGTEILSVDGALIGQITSGGFGPSAGAPVSMGYVDSAFAEDGNLLVLMVRGTPRPARIVQMPFVPHRYKRNTME